MTQNPQQTRLFNVYADTTGLDPDNLNKAIDDAAAQRAKILDILTRFPEKEFPAHTMHRFFPEMLLSSVRRALSFLKRDGIALKSETATVLGPYKRPVFTYRINTEWLKQQAA